MSYLANLRTGTENTESLEQLLSQLQACGLPRLGMVDKNGWDCSVNMYTNALGSEFKVRSDFGLKNPIAAAEQCLARMRVALATIKSPGGSA